MAKSLSILYISLFLPLVISAQTLSLDSCLQLARTNSRTIQSASLSVDQAKQLKAQALTKYFPQISGAAVGYHSLQPVVEVPSPLGSVGTALGLPASFGFLQYGYWAGVTAIQPVYVGGKIVNANRLAQVGVEAAQLQQQIAQRDQLENVEQTFWLIVGLYDKQTTLSTTLQLLDTIQHLVSTSVQAGIALPSDLLQVQMRQSELARTQVQLTNGISLATQSLCQMIGIPYSESLQLTSDSLLLTEHTLLLPDTTASTPEAQLLSLQTKASHLQYQMTLADALPQLALGATYGYGQLQADLLPHDIGHEHGNGALMVTLSLPVSAWWEMGHKLKAQALVEKKAQLEQSDKSELLQLRSKQAYQQWNEAEWMCQASQIALQQAQENYRLACLNYQAGLNTITDLLTAQALLSQSRNTQTDALIQRRLAYQHYLALTSQIP